MLVTPSGIFMFVRELQLLNELCPMLVTLSGIFMLLREVQLKNAISPISVTPSGIVILVREVQFENAEYPILVPPVITTVLRFGLGIKLIAVACTVAVSTALHSAKAESPISVTLSGIVTLFKELQP